jgi:5'-3' exoribonuclease 2
MGIPSYFNHILKNHNTILNNIKYVNCDYLFIDANSLIYDTINEYTHTQISNDIIYNNVYNKILNIITQTKPNFKTYVCFDGVAPIPKIMQQKQRRFKSNFTNKVLNKDVKSWNTNQISPGSDFMNDLDDYFTNKFKKSKNIFFSGPKEKGEGEHKIRQIIQNNNMFIHKNCIIYGLDADLIMIGLLLSLNSVNIFLYKETHYFSYISGINENEHYYFDIKKLGSEINCILNNDNKKQSIMDYCFLCFFCGNDFMPHLPSINLRNDGINILIECYLKIKEKIINIDTLKINWLNFRNYIYELNSNEMEKIKENILWKINLKKNIKTFTFDDKLNNLPVMDNEKEIYLLNNIDDYNSYILGQTDIKKICINYIEILEWTWYYYVGKKTNNSIYYKYNYGPLFKDLCNYIPITNEETILKENNNLQDINEITQLYYILPCEEHSKIIPKHIYDKTNKIVYNCYNSLKEAKYNIDYFLCRYFWECHFIFYEVDIDKLNNIITKLI